MDQNTGKLTGLEVDLLTPFLLFNHQFNLPPHKTSLYLICLIYESSPAIQQIGDVIGLHLLQYDIFKYEVKMKEKTHTFI